MQSCPDAGFGAARWARDRPRSSPVDILGGALHGPTGDPSSDSWRRGRPLRPRARCKWRRGRAVRVPAFRSRSLNWSPRCRDPPAQRDPPATRPADGREDLGNVGAEPAVGISAGPGQRHRVAGHLPHHVGGAFGDLRRMRDDHDTDVHPHSLARAAGIDRRGDMIETVDRAPGSMCRPTVRRERRPGHAGPASRSYAPAARGRKRFSSVSIGALASARQTGRAHRARSCARRRIGREP